MKNKKLIIISLIIIIIVATTFGIHNFYSSYMFNEDGSISGTSKEDLIEKLKQLEEKDDYIRMVTFSFEQNILNKKDYINLINFGLEKGLLTESESKEMLKLAE